VFTVDRAQTIPRAARQGEIVVAARDRIMKGGFLNDPAGFIAGMGKLLKTSLDAETISKYVQYASISRFLTFATR